MSQGADQLATLIMEEKGELEKEALLRSLFILARLKICKVNQEAEEVVYENKAVVENIIELQANGQGQK